MANITLPNVSRIGGPAYAPASGYHRSRSDAALQRLIIAVPILAVLYNAVFAMLAARGVPMNITVVIACEVVIILLTIGASIMAGSRRSDAVALGYIYVSAILALCMSLAHSSVQVDGLRNVLIIAGFTLLGTRASEQTIRTVFVTCTAVTLLVLIWEIAALDTYVTTFQPAEYLSKSRGYTIKEGNEEFGLSIGSLGYSSRFSFGIFTGPRTSSIFLEQVGINCFAIVLMVYLTTLWSRLPRWERLLSIGTLVLIVLSNNARMASLVMPVMVVGYFLYPRLPRYLNITLPIMLLIATVTLFQFTQPFIGDDLIGRLGVTYRFMLRLTTEDLLIGNPTLMARAFDTGYGYIVVATSIFGAIAYWAYLTFVVPQDSVTKRRATWAMNTYIYLWLLVGGTASFSMKTASLLWFLIGFVSAFPADTPGGSERESNRRPLLGAR